MTDPFKKVYRPTELRAFLETAGLSAKKGLSQNFLIDGNIIEKIVKTAQVSPGDYVIEVGPGPGALTQALLEKGAHVLAIEMDPFFSHELNRLQTEDSRLTIVCQDILAFPLNEHLKRFPKKVKVVANLPYHITTPILTRFLPLNETIHSLTIMIQKEFADRLVAKPRTPEYSSFTLFVEVYAHITHTFPVSAQCFYPRPKVNSTVVHCELHPPSQNIDPTLFFQLTRTAFGQRRKMLRSSLKKLYPTALIEEALTALSLPLTTRPEELSLDTFFSLYFFFRRGR